LAVGSWQPPLSPFAHIFHLATLQAEAIHLELSRRRLTIHFRVYSHFRCTSQQNSDNARK